MLPLFGLAGQMGAGKSSVAKILVDKYGFLEVSQAEPIKELAATVFGFDVDALWGPSSERNKLRIDGWWDAPDWFERLDLINAMGEDGILTSSDLQSQRVADITQEGIDKIAAFYKENKGLTARYVLQILGTEVGREIRQTLWTEKAINKSFEQLALNCPGIKPLNGAVISDVRFRSELLAIKRAGGTVIKVVDPDAPPPPENEHASESELRGIPDFWFDSIWYNSKDGLINLEWAVGQFMHDDYGINR